MLKIYLKKKIEISSKLNQTLSKIESRLFIIEKQNANQLIKAETYASVMKTITKMTKNKNEKKTLVKNTTTTNIMTTRKGKKLIIRIKNEIEKKILKMISNVEFFKKIKKITKNFKIETIKLKWFFNENLIIFSTSIAVKKKLKEEKKNQSNRKINENFKKIIWNHDTRNQN